MNQRVAHTHLAATHGAGTSDGDRQRARAFYQMDQGGRAHPKGGTTGHEL